MGNFTDSKESRCAQEFLLKSKKAFAEKIARNTVQNIDVFSCLLDEKDPAANRFTLVGSVETTSPTGKLKTYRYSASVAVNGKDCSIASLELSAPEE